MQNPVIAFQRNRPDYPASLLTGGQVRIITAIIFFLALFFYLYMLEPSLSWGDGIRMQHEAVSGESYILSELFEKRLADDPFPFALLGVAAWDHPLYVVIGYSLVQIGTHISPNMDALRLINSISAVFGAGSIAIFFYISIALTNSLRSAAIGGLFLAVSHTFWWHSVTPEVYTLHIFLVLLGLTFFLKFYNTGDKPALYKSAFVLGLAASNHFLALLMLPAALIYFGLNSSKIKRIPLRNIRLSVFLILSFLAGWSIILIQAARMLRTFSFHELLGPVMGTTFFSTLSFVSILESFLQYVILLFFQFGVIGVVIGIFGFVTAYRSGTDAIKIILPIYLVYTIFGVIYQVADQFAFYLTSHVVFALSIPLGISHALKKMSPANGVLFSGILIGFIALTPTLYSYTPGLLREIGLDERAFGIPEIGVGIRDGLRYYIDPNKQDENLAYTFGIETLSNLPPNAVVVAQWWTDTDEYFVFRYFSAVENLRPDVEIFGWPAEDPINFDSSLVTNLIEEELGQRPIFIASLSEEYYGAETLLERYCIIPRHNLYQILDVDLISKEQFENCISSTNGYR